MDEPDTAAILPVDELASVTEELTEDSEDKQEEDVPTSRCRSRRPPFPCPLPLSVEPVLFLSMFAVTLQTPLSTQYLWDRVSEDVGFNGTRGSECVNGSVPHDPLQKEVETLTARWNLYISLAGFSVGLLVVPLLGSWSDLVGRRPMLIIANLGLALTSAVYLVVTYLKLPVVYFVVGRLVGGLFGDFNAVLAASFSHVADNSDKQSRTFRVAVMECCAGISGMLASIIGGQWLKAQGYINPLWLGLASFLASALYAYLFVCESVLPEPGAKLLTSRNLKAVWHLYSSGGSNSEGSGPYLRCKLWLYTLCFFLVVMVHFGCSSLYVLYEMGSPLCWGPTLIGYGSAAKHLAYITSLVGLKIMQRCLADSWVALVGLASNIIGLIVFSVAKTTVVIFTGYGLLFLSMAVTPVVRSKLSKLVSPSEQGVLFAGIACTESLCLLVGSTLYNSLYPATLQFMKGFSFLLSAFILLIPAGIIGTLEILNRRTAHKDSTAS